MSWSSLWAGIIFLTHTSLSGGTTPPAVSLTVEGKVSLVGPYCPGTVRLFCEGVKLSSLRWRYNNTIDIQSFETNALPTSFTPTNPAFKNIEIVTVTRHSDIRFANFTSILTVNLTQLQEQNVAEINCGDPGTVGSEPVSLQPNIPKRPNITAVIATYQQSMLVNISLAWKKPEYNCPEYGDSLFYELTLSGLEPIHISQNSCMETVCMKTISIQDQVQGDSYNFTVAAVDGVGLSEVYVFPGIIEHQSQRYFSPEVQLVFLNESCQATVHCGQQKSNTACERRLGTDPDHFDQIISTLPIGIAPDTTYYFQFSLQESDTLSIVQVLSATCTNSTVMQPTLEYLAFLILVAFFIVLLFAVLGLVHCTLKFWKGKKLQSEVSGVGTNGSVTFQLVAPPVIKTQPDAVGARVNGSAYFIVMASGEGLTYQWFGPDRTSLVDIHGKIVGAKTARLTIFNIFPGDLGYYQAWVSNAGGSVTSASARLTIIAPPVIETQPVAVGARVGAPASFIVMASGEGLTYQWFGPDRTSLVDKLGKIIGAKTARLTILNIYPGDLGYYHAYVSNAGGSVTSASARLTISSLMDAPTTGKVSAKLKLKGELGQSNLTDEPRVGAHKKGDGEDSTDSQNASNPACEVDTNKVKEKLQTKKTQQESELEKLKKKQEKTAKELMKKTDLLRSIEMKHESEIAEKDEALWRKDKELAGREKLLREQKQVTQERDEEIKDLKSYNKQLTEDVQKLTAMNGELQGKIRSLEGDIRELNQTIQKDSAEIRNIVMQCVKEDEMEERTKSLVKSELKKMLPEIMSSMSVQKTVSLLDGNNQTHDVGPSYAPNNL